MRELPHAPRPETERGTKSESGERPCPKNSTPRTHTYAHVHALLKKDIHEKTLRTDARMIGTRLPRTPCPAHLSGAQNGA